MQVRHVGREPLTSEETLVSCALGRPAGHVSSPPVVPPAVSQCSLVLASPPDASEPWNAIDLPASLQGAVARRQRHFRAGRYCAQEALRTLDRSLAGAVPGRAPSGAPVWPAGTVGSITHTEDFVSAAVGRDADFAGVGIDTEALVTESRAHTIAPAVALPDELAAAREAGLDAAQAFTLVFSAKESVFKCLYGRVGRVFGFHDARIAFVDSRAGTFTVHLVRTLAPGVPAEMVLHGRFALERLRVHTGVTIAGSAL